tara:strand:+ start:284 stop:700 length:417 start_codon:yes stop_codon:yes gene_type:complete
MKKVIFIIGVSGSGKSTIGKLLADDLNVPFFDGDDCHPESNVLKMSNGQALNDADRLGWLQSLKRLAKKPSAKKVVSECILNELPIPSLSKSINFLNSFALANSSANIIQAQRDYFGAHAYQRIDDASGEPYHTNCKE